MKKFDKNKEANFLVDIICPSCDGNGCGICQHIGKMKAKMLISDNLSKLTFTGFHPLDFDDSFFDENKDNENFELHYMKLKL